MGGIVVVVVEVVGSVVVALSAEGVVDDGVAEGADEHEASTIAIVPSASASDAGRARANGRDLFPRVTALLLRLADHAPRRPWQRLQAL